MTKKKGRAGWHQLATLNTYKSSRNSTVLATRFKGFIITLALWGCLPLSLANWLIRLGEPRDE